MPKHKTIDEYIRDCPDAVQPLLETLRAFIHETLPGAGEGMKYGAPIFYNANKVPVIYLFGGRDHVNFGFLKSAELCDPDGVLKGSGKPSKHLQVFPDRPIDQSVLINFVRQCDDMKP
ncbi:DUF1801 domain-containing protein [Hoeflea prorocentri]|uniref:DUF1801 domain-containing protein n=1 Tax=Hoeflea prorocentri TaxID=1922333 RepID=A0A9X3ZK41_9HYPH|nr:DUF1801 domain-containing protein [Hoeflea prorocentri]MCY6383490.1 DUF1801 domain-containing protein [Hoeflea prorocentri]MDA5401290.1 DUF1801 domain-containing protein [Hoeflea prorocentri]